MLVRPGDVAQKGQVLATLDCKSASAQSKAMQRQARALSATQEAISREAGRMSGLLAGGYVSPDEVERRTGDSASKQAELLAANARLVRASLEVDDCVLRAPFAGEVGERLLDAGGFARPGAPLRSAAIRGDAATIFVVSEGVAQKRKVAMPGESGGSLFGATTLAAGSLVVTAGRALIKDGDHVAHKLEPFAGMTEAKAPSTSPSEVRP